MTKIIKDVNMLRTKSEPVTSVQEAKDIIVKLEAALIENDGLGLAAIQIGIPKQVGIIKNINGAITYLINPEVISQEDPYFFHGEGCLSFPAIYVKSKRYEHFVIKNQIIDGDKFRGETQYYFGNPEHKEYKEKTEGDFESLSCQHEIDHFMGKIIIDEWEQIAGTVTNKGKKVGRNDPCPCGSAKKYKKCCGKDK